MHQPFSIDEVVPAVIKSVDRYDNPSLRYCRARDLLWQAACKLDGADPKARFVSLSEPVRRWYDSAVAEVVRILGSPF